jgi:flagellar hook assembly protein FlgD
MDPTEQQTIDQLTAQVAQTVGVDASAKVLIDGINARVASAITAAQAGDVAAVTTQLTSLNNDLTTSSTALAASVAANQPPAPPAHPAA